MENEDKKVSKANKGRYELTEVVTQTSLGIMDTKSNALLGQEELLVEILNKLDKIEKVVV